MNILRFFGALVLFAALSACNNHRYLAGRPDETKPCRKRFEQFLMVKNKIYFEKQAYNLGDAQEYLYYDLEGVIRQKPNLKVLGMRPLLWLHFSNDTSHFKVKQHCVQGQWRADTTEWKLFTNDSLYHYVKKDGDWDLVKQKKNKASIRRWLMLKVGEAPVLWDSTATQRTVKSMINVLRQKGYADAEVRDSVVIKGYKATVSYYVRTGSPILIDSVFFESEDRHIDSILQATAHRSLLKAQPNLPIPYLDKALFDQEKARITQEIRNHGYEQFSWNYIQFEADTVNARRVRPNPKQKPFPEQGEQRANIYVHVLPHSDTIAEHPSFRIRQVYIVPELVLQGKRIDYANYHKTYVALNTQGKRRFYDDSTRIDSTERVIQIILRRKGGKAMRRHPYSRHNSVLRNEFLSDAVEIRAGDAYRYDAMRSTINHLSALDVFKFPNVEYLPSGEKGELDCWIRMKPAKKQVFGWDAEANTYNANVGLAVNFNYRNRNIFKGAESFSLNAEAGVDFILNPDSSRVADYRKNGGLIPWLNLLDVSGEAALRIPRFLFFHKFFPHLLNARTDISLSYRYLQQSNDFRVSSFSGQFSYQFGLQAGQLSHRFSLSPALLNFSLKPQLSQRFEDRLAARNLPLLKNLKEQVFIPSIDFSYTLSTPTKTNGNSWFFKFYNELAGNVWWVVDAIFLPKKDMTLLGTSYSQFYRFDIDARGSFYLGRKHSLVTRLMFGMAIPYGNSNRVPFSRQFFLGGPNSMRAWRTRFLGPGRQEVDPAAAFQLGDVRLELNLEYRFKFNSWIAGALFLDAGNVWLLRPDTVGLSPTFPNKQPETGVFGADFLREMALGAGLGIRFDFTFFILRFDFAMQLHNPAGYGLLPSGKLQYWNYNFWARGRQNWVLGVGYPF